MGYHPFSIVGAFFNQEKILVGAFSMIVKTDGSFAALNKMFRFLKCAELCAAGGRGGKYGRNAG